MQKPTLFLIVLLLPIFSIGQDSIHLKMDSLKFVNDMPYICHSLIIENETITNVPGCGDELFWSVVKQKKEAIPFLLEKLTDSTMTVANVPNFGYYYSVADIAFVAIEEIVRGIPTFELLGVEFDQEGCGYCAYWQHLNKNYQNRVNFKIAVQKWYDSNKDNLVWVESNEYSSCDCSGPHPNNGHYELKK